MASLLFLVQIVNTILTGVAVGAWTYFDAESRNAVYATHIAVIVAVILPAILAYLYYRDRIGPRAHEQRPVQKVAGAIGSGSAFALLLGGVLTPPDPFASAYYTASLVPIGVALGFVWFYGVLPRVSTVS